ncbi:MAG: 3,4-dihydroxy-2-butanone-4-phosphate synthase [Myxococcota bacterium]|jgi:3,4-dihydroxy 2-butanone 4-phosphate synthase/GTP cyclohydrolase II|nr:3,4-dihydroxy-2-butanone-4-phosphate synthase [Myxococcota bacterium]
MAVASIATALEALRRGEMVILVDDENRENEGDLCMLAELVTPEAINFMAKHGRGLICLAMTPERLERLEIPMMVRQNTSRLGTAFTVSIEARTGVTTGISAADRARTIRVATDDGAKPDDLVRPGHIFPLAAKPGGVLVRTGQTEGSVDLARLAGFKPAAVICEIMSDDGTMARMPELERFAAQHQMPIVTIADLIRFRLEKESLVEAILERPCPNAFHRDFQATVFRSLVDGSEHLALRLGNIMDDEPLLVRVHTESKLSDVFAAEQGDAGVVQEAMRRIAEAGRGVLLYISRPEWTPSQDLRALAGETIQTLDGDDALNAPPSAERMLGIGSQCLRALGVRRMRLLSNSESKLVGLAGFGLDVVERIPVDLSSSSVRTRGGVFSSLQPAPGAVATQE